MILCAVLLIPMLGTVFGAAAVFFMRETSDRRLEKILLGFAGGVMMAASVWSLLIPSIEMMEGRDGAAWFPALAGFCLGVFFFVGTERLVFSLRKVSSRKAMLVFAVTLHNIPEGMAVGVACAGMSSGDTGITFASVIALAAGIAIQNLPDGAIISMPLRNEGMSRRRAFLYGVLSGITEPAGALAAMLFLSRVLSLLPYLLSFAAGAMFYVVMGEIIPEAQMEGRSSAGTVGASLGFVLMMVLDIALG